MFEIMGVISMTEMDGQGKEKSAWLNIFIKMPKVYKANGCEWENRRIPDLPWRGVLPVDTTTMDSKWTLRKGMYNSPELQTASMI